MEGNPNDRDPPKISYIDRGLALGLALGAGLGAALSAATDNSACLAIGIGCGMTFGIGIGSILQREHEDLGDYQYDGGQGVSENETSRVARWQASIARLRRRIFYAKHQVYSKARSLKRKEPDCSIVAASPAKGRKLREEKGTGLSLGWALAREDVLILTDGKLVFGDWHIPPVRITVTEYERTLTRCAHCPLDLYLEKARKGLSTVSFSTVASSMPASRSLGRKRSLI